MTDLDDLETEFPGWHYWCGVNNQFYARRERSSPPIVFRAATQGELREQVREYLTSRSIH